MLKLHAEPVAILIMGPTAAGKTDVTVGLADRLPLHVISVDSAQIYRGLDVGTAKPPPEVLSRVPHALIDICDPDERYSAAAFVRDARREIEVARDAGRIPVLVGGTMFYFAALVRGLSPLPPADDAIRRGLETEADRRGWQALHAELAAVDPASAARIGTADRQRIQRALEIYRATGSAPSQLRGRRDAGFRVRLIQIAYAPSDRSRLHTAIGQRFRRMARAGLLEETARLMQADPEGRATPALRMVGYRQVAAYLQGHGSYDEMLAAGTAATRQLAKRQLTWLRGAGGLVWIDALSPSPDSLICDYLNNKLPGVWCPTIRACMARDAAQ